MRIAGLCKNDIVNGEGISVSIFLQGCPIHCPGCHNPETWNPSGGTEIEIEDLLKEITQVVTANGLQRNIAILGGEPLWDNGNRTATLTLIHQLKIQFPTSKIYLWTGYTKDFLKEECQKNSAFEYILSKVEKLIIGPYEQDKRDIRLHLRGSTNQEVICIGEGQRNGIKNIWDSPIE